MAWRILVCLVMGYLFGCFSTGLLVGKANHVDIRKYGSGNPGTTNAYRTMGWKAGLITLAGDMLKCIIPCLLARYIFFADVMEADEAVRQLLILYTSLGVTLGHNYPFYLKFRGGKGVACMAATALMYDWRIFAVGIVIFIVLVAVTRYVSVTSLVCSLVFYSGVLLFAVQRDLQIIIVGAFFVVSTFVMHIPNIKRLINGTENRFIWKGKIKTDGGKNEN